ncbi:MAG: 4-hydroxy-3-methylbut-2-enyl diphosphate reductase [Nitrospinae bacterium]|nr:4-hydroxy-3-methylbut-2-enyl diphosphate reductase [Nitrospinota bacterium]MBI3813666.1 4-hydroxy-3-methylbut-2-enyl diphosphate reductase [Nitrospinota bacterium]
MQVKLAKTAGFCMGVKRAMDIVLDASEEEKGGLYTYGPLIHNPQVIEMLESKNVRVVKDVDNLESGRIVIRTHGITPAVRQKIKSKGLRINDATCPLVARVQSIIKKYANRGYYTVIIGDEGHAEVVGLMGFTEGRGFVINSAADADRLPPMEKVCVVGQTTLNVSKYREITDKLKERYAGCVIADTICDATEERQEEVLKLSKEVDAMIVVGGKNSANTARLASLSESTGRPTFLVETEAEMDESVLSRFNVVGVTAGASTPNWMIMRVMKKLEGIKRMERRGIRKYIYGTAEFFIRSNIYIAIGSAFLTYGTSLLSGIEPSFYFMSLSFLYFFSMYNINHLSDRESVRLNEPDRVEFYEKNRNILLAAGIASLVISLFLSLLKGLTPFLIMLVSACIGVAYSVKIAPPYILKYMRYRRLKDIPASKDIFVALAWATVCVLAPVSFSGWERFGFAAIISFVFVFLISYIRSVLFDIRDIQGDRFVGRETIPIIIGKEKTKVFLLTLAGIAAAGLFISSKLGWTSGIGYLFIITIIYTVFYLYLYHKRIISQGLSCEAVVDGKFILTGLIAFIWAYTK